MCHYTHKQDSSLSECAKWLEFYKPEAIIISHKPHDDGVSVIFSTSEGEYLGVYSKGLSLVLEYNH